MEKTTETTEESTELTLRKLLLDLVAAGEWTPDNAAVLTAMTAVRPHVPDELADRFDAYLYGDAPFGPVMAALVEAELKAVSASLGALDAALMAEMERRNNVINAMLGVENGIPLMSPDDEVKLADMLRQKAGMEKRKLERPVELSVGAGPAEPADGE